MNNKIEIIPAIDLIDGKCVRLSQGDYNQKTIYNENPLEVALMFEAVGIRRLDLVDLDGAKAKHIVNHKVLELISTKTNLIIDFGGGLKSDKDLEIAFNSGAQMVTGGSIAVREKDTFLKWLQKYGSEKIILGADAKDGNIAVGGWLESTELHIIEFISEFHKKGIVKVISMISASETQPLAGRRKFISQLALERSIIAFKYQTFCQKSKERIIFLKLFFLL